MTTILDLCAAAADKNRFTRIQHYVDFAKWYLDFLSDSDNYEAKITSRKEPNYKFYQYKKEANYTITRPINEHIFLPVSKAESAFLFFQQMLKETDTLQQLDEKEGAVLNSAIYTLQQCIGCALDALPASRSNTARKINGDLFERLMMLTFKTMGFQVDGCVEYLSIADTKMQYQHDLLFRRCGIPAAIGSVKTSSKDRIDKVFLDKLFYNKLKKVDIPHFAIFLGDVQRAGKEPDYGVSQTFLSGHFKAYTLLMNPMDGVYYCDLRPVMKTDSLLRKEIKRLDELLCKDIWKLLAG